jgi:hypothetical protein
MTTWNHNPRLNHPLHRHRSESSWRLVLTLYVVAFGLNYFWEIAQSPLYLGMERIGTVLWHCLLASLVDGLFVVAIFATGWRLLGRSFWFERPGVKGYVLMLALGLVFSISVEWLAVHLIGLWSYSNQMIVVPSLRVGLAPVVQLVVLPPLIFRIVARWRHKRDCLRPSSN